MPSAENRQKLRSVLLDPSSYATTVITIVLDTYGFECVEWAPETIRLEVEEDFKLDMPLSLQNKLQIAISLLTSDAFFKQLPTFVFACNVLSNQDVSVDVVDIADAAECAWGLTEALLLSPPDEDDPEPFTNEIRAYIGKILDAEGIQTPPDLLNLAIRDTPSGSPDFSAMPTEDPDMFEADFKVQQGRSEEIKEMVKENLQELLAQLASLPLENGDVKGLAARVTKYWQETAK